MMHYCILFFVMIRQPPRSTRTDTLFPYPTLFRSFARYVAIFGIEMVRDTPLRLTRQDMSESCAHSAPTHLPYNSQGRAALCGWQIAKQGRRSKMTWRPFAQKNGQCGTERHPPLRDRKSTRLNSSH